MAEGSLTARITRRGADSLRAGHRWVYRTELLEVGEATPPGALLTVVDPRGKALGTGLYSTASQIAVRLVSEQPDLRRAVYLQEVRQRVLRALARRRAVAPLEAQGTSISNAQRLVFSEADDLPGIVVDRYAEVLVVQLLTQGTAQDDLRAVLVEVLREAWEAELPGLSISERPDPRIRELEQLPAPPEAPLFTAAETYETSAGPLAGTRFLLNGLSFGYQASAGQKTGAFLDQRLNYRAAAEWVRRSGRTGHALDVCTYQGGFALHLAQVCQRVTGVDQSRAALEMADRNLTENVALPGKVDWIEADAFEFLRALDDARPSRPVGAGSESLRARKQARPAGIPERFDAIVLDPPAFAKSARALDGALRGYKEMNLRAMRLLAPGGTLVTCSCSHHVSRERFMEAVREAAADAGRRVQVLESRAAAPDHPEVLTLPETQYLKCLICRVE